MSQRYVKELDHVKNSISVKSVPYSDIVACNVLQTELEVLLSRPFLEESCTRVPERSRNFVCASDRSGKDSQALFIPWKR